jgi:hypothetical protein
VGTVNVPAQPEQPRLETSTPPPSLDPLSIQQNIETTLQKANTRRAELTNAWAEVQQRAGFTLPAAPTAYNEALGLGSMCRTLLVSTSKQDSPTKSLPRSQKRAKRRRKERERKKESKEGNRRQSHVGAPSINDCLQALEDVRNILRPLWPNGIGHLPFIGDDLLRFRLELMEAFLAIFTSSKFGHGRKTLTWQTASLHAAKTKGRGKGQAESLRAWTREFLEDRTQLSINLYGSWNESVFEKGDLHRELEEHLLSLPRKEVRAEAVLRYMQNSEVQKKYRLQESISIKTANNWMGMMEFRWAPTKKGYYTDGHERKDVVTYRQAVFLPAIYKLLPDMQTYQKDNKLVEEPDNWPPECRHLPQVVLWIHYKSTFYANNRCDLCWNHPQHKPELQQKGDGPSIMVSDFVSADYGFLRSKDGAKEARKLFKAGKL